MSSDSDNEEPQFDFSGVNRLWRKRWTHTLRRVTDITTEIAKIDDLPEGKTFTFKEEAVIIGQHSRLLAELEEIAAEQECLVAQVLTSIPQSWLSSDAPPDLNWKDPTSLDYVLEHRYPALIGALNNARREAPKN